MAEIDCPFCKTPIIATDCTSKACEHKLAQQLAKHIIKEHPVYVRALRIIANMVVE